MNTEDPNNTVDRLAAESISQGDATGWFDQVYRAAGDDPSRIPWADEKPNRWLVEWLDREHPETKGSTAVVVGCGLGDDAEELAAPRVRGHGLRHLRDRDRVGAPHGSPIRRSNTGTPTCSRSRACSRARSTSCSRPTRFSRLPVAVRGNAIAAVASLAAPGGSVLIVSRGREDDEPTWAASLAALARPSSKLWNAGSDARSVRGLTWTPIAIPPSDASALTT